MKFSQIGVVCAVVLSLSNPPALAQSAEQSQAIAEQFEKYKGRTFSCTASRKALRKLSKQYPAYHFVFAGRKDTTITGIRGCGFAWNTDLKRAQKVAMENCKEWEVKYGTAGGKKICRFLR